jgi:hypothetical protein
MWEKQSGAPYGRSKTAFAPSLEQAGASAPPAPTPRKNKSKKLSNEMFG